MTYRICGEHREGDVEARSIETVPIYTRPARIEPMTDEQARKCKRLEQKYWQRHREEVDAEVRAYLARNGGRYRRGTLPGYDLPSLRAVPVTSVAEQVVRVPFA